MRTLLAMLWFPTETAARARQFEFLKRSGRLTVGVHTYGTPRVITFDGDETRIRIGSYTSIAETAVFIAGGNHNPRWVSTFPFRARWNMPGALLDGQPSTKGDIVVGSDVWIAEGATILSGVTIGDGAIVAASTVVTRDVPPYALVAGSPATVKSQRFDVDTSERLLALRWWEWEEEVIRRNVNLLSAPLTEDSLARLEQLNSS